MNHKIYIKRPIISLSVAASVAMAVASSGGQISADGPASAMSVATDTETTADSIVSEGQRLSDIASELYKKVKFMQYEGEVESILYPAVFEANKAAGEALLSSDIEELRIRNRNILIDLNPVLLEGAVFYSTKGDNESLPRFARAYIDVQEMPEMKDAGFKRDMRVFPTLVYNAAYGASRDGNLEKAKEYFQLYLDCGDADLKENVYAYLGQACMQTGDYARGAEVLTEAARLYPSNMQMIMLAMQCCIDGGYTDRLQPLLDRALILDPSDERIQNVQARLYERQGDFKKALDIYYVIAEAHPNSLENTRAIATCLFNLGAEMYNRSIMESDDKSSAKARRQSKAYFDSASDKLEQVLATTPSDIRLLNALAQTYASLGDRENFDRTNTRIRALGGKGIAFNDMPVMLGSSSGADGEEHHAVKVPTYEEFARPYIEERLGTWAMRGEFEKLDDYRKRMAGGEGVDAYNAINKEAADAYIKEFGKKLVLTDLKRSDYDIDNETYMIDTPYGPTVIKVPLKNKEAEAFKSAWETAQIRAPRFIIRDNKVAIAEITYMVNGRKYTYKADDAATYRAPSVYVDVNGILAAAQAGDGSGHSKSPAGATAMIWTESDVDKDIPVTNRKSENVFALIIANENYDKASDVFGALHDGHTLKEYCTRTLGIPEGQTVLLNNATGNQLRDALEQLKRRVRGRGSDAEIIFYYAGHGLPDDATKEAYMMPVDANPLTISTLVPMKQIYRELASADAAAVSVFLDACFSGAGRDGNSINKDARGVVLKAQAVAPEGNMYVLSAAGAQQTAMPYKEKHHGLFTYYLLRKLQESKGNATLKEISDYVITNVTNTSNSNASIGKEQNPTVTTSGKMSTLWERKKLKSN